MEPLGIALVGCGVVGGGVARLLTQHSQRLAERAGRPLSLRCVVVRNPDKPRAVALPRELFTTQAEQAWRNPRVHVVVELIGGLEPARTIILESLRAGKDVVTANKAVLARHGTELFDAAREHKRTIAFEASVGGGIPIVGAIAHGLAANQISSIKAILNGTSNFILTQMSEHGQSYPEALAEAQRRGFAEADPSMDVDGTDAAHKLAILARLAFGAEIPLEVIERRGIDILQAADIGFARELGYVIKLIAEAWVHEDQLALHVEPTLVRRFHPLADVRGANNAIHVVGDAVGETMYYGPGAGEMPTASAVAADLIDLAVGRAQLTFQTLRLWSNHRRLGFRSASAIKSRFYLRVNVVDHPGVLAEVASVLAKHHISIASVVQHEAVDDEEGTSVPIVIRSHNALLGELRQAVARLDKLECVVGPSAYFPVADW